MRTPRRLGPPRVDDARHHHAAGLRVERVTDVPAWAPYLPLARWRSLLEAVDRDLGARGLLARFQGDHFTAAFPDGRVAELGLVNLAARCRGADAGRQRDLVRDHFDAVLGPLTAPAPALADAPAYADIASRLVVHLYRADAIGDARDRIVARPLCDGLVSALAVDLGTAIASLPVDLPARWGRSEDELFRAGLANVERRRVRREVFPSGALPGVVVSGDHHSVTSQVHFLNGHLGRRHPAGAIVGLPARSMIFAIPLRTGADADAMERLTRAVTAGLDLLDGVASDPMFADQRFSPDLYWWRDGELRRLPAARTPAGPAVMPPDEMVAALLARARAA
jgi:hypothetical protein